MRAPLTRQQDAILRHMLAAHRRLGTALVSLADDMRWRRAPRFTQPTAYVWEIAHAVDGRRLNPMTVRYARSLRSKAGDDPVRRGAHRAGVDEGYRLEMSQRLAPFARPDGQADERLARDLAALAARGLVVVDRPVVHLTRRGADVAASLDAEAA